MAAVFIAALGAIGGNFIQGLIHHHTDRAVLFTVLYQLIAVKDLGNFLRLCVGAKIVILGSASQHPIPYTAAYRIGGIAGTFQHLDEPFCRCRQYHFTGSNKKGAQKPKGQTDKIKDMPVSGGNNGAKQGGLPPNKAGTFVCLLTGGGCNPMNPVDGGKQVKQAVKKVVLGLVQLGPQRQVAQHHSKAHKNGQKHIQQRRSFACKIGGSQPPKAEKSHRLRYQHQGASLCFEQHIGTGQCAKSGTDAGNGKLRDDLIRALRTGKAVYNQQHRHNSGQSVEDWVVGMMQRNQP